jgi:hypothetical protein
MTCWPADGLTATDEVQQSVPAKLVQHGDGLSRRPGARREKPARIHQAQGEVKGKLERPPRFGGRTERGGRPLVAVDGREPRGEGPLRCLRRAA